MNKHTKTIIKRTSVTLLGLAVVVGIAYQTWLFSVHTVIPNSIYRSAQLPTSILKKAIQSKEIKTIINLRGSNPDDPWYQKEFNLSQEMNVKHYDVTLSSYLLPRQEYLRKLVYFLMTAPQPILLHCLSGSDRSGLAAAIAMILSGNTSLPESEHQFSFAYFVTAQNSIGKQVFSYYVHWLKKNHLNNNRVNFLKWMCTKNPMNQENRNYSSFDTYPYNDLFLKEVCHY